MAILNYTTTIAPDKTISEIQKTISSKGATKIMVDYENGKPVALSFQIMRNNRPVSFRLPANWHGVLTALNKAKIPGKFKCNDQAIRVCWRIIKDWVEAQVALIEAGQADITTVFLPYAVMMDNKTVAETMLSEKGNQLLLA